MMLNDINGADPMTPKVKAEMAWAILKMAEASYLAGDVENAIRYVNLLHDPSLVGQCTIRGLKIKKKLGDA